MPETVNRRGLLLILSSPSGAGKSTLARRLMDWDKSLRFSVSATTRAPRIGEEDGRDYYFRSHAEFAEMVAAGEMLEHAEVFGNFYGSPKAPVEAAMKAGRDTVFDIDWQGGQQIKQHMRDDVVSIFVLPPSIAEFMGDRLTVGREIAASGRGVSGEHGRAVDAERVGDNLAALGPLPGSAEKRP